MHLEVSPDNWFLCHTVFPVFKWVNCREYRPIGANNHLVVKISRSLVNAMSLHCQATLSQFSNLDSCKLNQSFLSTLSCYKFEYCACIFSSLVLRKRTSSLQNRLSSFSFQNYTFVALGEAHSYSFVFGIQQILRNISPFRTRNTIRCWWQAFLFHMLMHIPTRLWNLRIVLIKWPTVTECNAHHE